MAFLAASLHIISPAGLFLSAPYAESVFALLSFWAYRLYARGRWPSKASHEEHHTHAYLVGAGLLFGLATAVRSNGLLNGAILLVDLIVTLRSGSGPLLQARRLRRLVAIGGSGALLALGALIPQMLAYGVFCQTASPRPSPSSASTTPNAEARPWCSNAVPSVYAWAQDHYWSVMIEAGLRRLHTCLPRWLTIVRRKVGLLRYWTWSNAPLFLMASPMLAIIVTSSAWAFGATRSVDLGRTRAPITATVDGADVVRTWAPPASTVDMVASSYLRRLALPQLLLAVLALSSYHVQIINRICSAYVVWYWCIATAMVDDRPPTTRSRLAKLAVRWMVMHALIQAGLYASFLPPA